MTDTRLITLAGSRRQGFVQAVSLLPQSNFKYGPTPSNVRLCIWRRMLVVTQHIPNILTSISIQDHKLIDCLGAAENHCRTQLSSQIGIQQFCIQAVIPVSALDGCMLPWRLRGRGLLVRSMCCAVPFRIPVASQLHLR